MEKTGLIKFLRRFKNLSKAEEETIIQQTNIVEYPAKNYFVQLEIGKIDERHKTYRFIRNTPRPPIQTQAPTTNPHFQLKKKT